MSPTRRSTCPKAMIIMQDANHVVISTAQYCPAFAKSREREGAQRSNAFKWWKSSDLRSLL